VILDAAQDVVGARRLPKDDEGVAIHQVFVVVLQIGELASYLTSKMETVDAVVSDALREVAVTIRERTCVDAVRQLDGLPQRSRRRSRLRHVGSSPTHFVAPSARRS